MLNIATRLVNLGTRGIAYSSKLEANSSTGPLSWAEISPFNQWSGKMLNALGLALAADGSISGTPNKAVADFPFSVQVANASTQELAVAAYTLTVYPPPLLTYAAPTDNNVRPEPPVAPMGPAGSIVKDDISGYRILRVTDATSTPNDPAQPGIAFTPSAGSAETCRWSALGNYFCVFGGAGWNYIYQLNKQTLQAQVMSPGGVLGWGWESMCFDSKVDTLMYGNFGAIGQIYSLDIATGATAIVWDFGPALRAIGQQYCGSMSVGDNRNLALRLGTQDTAIMVGALVQGVQLLLDTSRGTVNGVRVPNWPTLQTHTVHNVRLGQDGRYCKITMTASSNQAYLIWDLEAPALANAIIALQGYGAPDYVTGHQAIAWGRYINSNLIRDITTAAGAHNPKPFYTGGPWPPGMDNYYSWCNQQQNMTVPVLETIIGINMGSGSYPTQDFGVATTPYARELLAISTDGLGTIWRLCHHYSYSNQYTAGVWNFNDGVFGNISRDGRYVLFSSNWANTLGGTGQFRTDCFVLELL